MATNTQKCSYCIIPSHHPKSTSQYVSIRGFVYGLILFTIILGGLIWCGINGMQSLDNYYVNND